MRSPAVCLRPARPAANTSTVAHPHMSTVAMQLTILFIAKSRWRLEAAVRGSEGVGTSGCRQGTLAHYFAYTRS
jgi:hypothetical protein